ncbi:histone deacetylase 6/10 [Angomonas deanei]|nr:histone deacetylase 6/10 [Angomonas deanei]|eukprot:EPY27331.1 histone deacetylase 6/10 [Angomonas deanei]
MLKHDPHGHRSPETSHRLQRGIDMLRQCDQSANLIPPEMCNDDALSNTSKKSAHNLSHFIPPRLATKEEVYTFHDKAVYEDFLEKGTVLENLKSDVYCNEGTSSRAVKLSVGGIIDASSLILQNVTRTTPAKEPSDSIFSSFCLLRPPGHHCTANRPSGFCLVNNVCLAAENLMRKCTVPEGSTTRPPRIAILDLDVHFGEGIAEYVDHFQSSSGECPLLYLSIHRYDDGGFYPFEKTADATFTGAGNKGSIGNMAIDTHASDVEKCEQVISDFLLEKLIDKVVLPRLDRFKPEFAIRVDGVRRRLPGSPLGEDGGGKWFLPQRRGSQAVVHVRQ